MSEDKRKKGYYMRSFRAVLDYLYKNNVPANLVYNDGSEQPVYIISYDKFNIICQDLDKKKSFVVLKHALKRIETEIKLEGVIEKDMKNT
ncbi:MAG: hypothetical protein ACOCRX_06925 [Candidatus Woesearchaeota archaeon]